MLFLGTTSACAENTHGFCLLHAEQGNYLRVRGEYVSESTIVNQFPELPPRARRIRHGIIFP